MKTIIMNRGVAFQIREMVFMNIGISLLTGK